MRRLPCAVCAPHLRTVRHQRLCRCRLVPGSSDVEGAVPGSVARLYVRAVQPKRFDVAVKPQLGSVVQLDPAVLVAHADLRLVFQQRFRAPQAARPTVHAGHVQRSKPCSISVIRRGAQVQQFGQRSVLAVYSRFVDGRQPVSGPEIEVSPATNQRRHNLDVVRHCRHRDRRLPEFIVEVRVQPFIHD